MKTAIVIGVGPERGLRCSVFSVRAWGRGVSLWGHWRAGAIGG